MLKNQNSIQLNSFNSVYDEVFVRGKESSVILAGTLVSFLDEAYEYRDTDYFATKYNEGIATTDYDVPEIETTDKITVLYKGTPYEQVKHETTQTPVTKHYTATYNISSFSPAVVIENSLLGKSLNHQNYLNVYARCRRLVPGDKFLLRAVAGSYNYGDPLYATQTDNGIYVTTEEGGMFIGWAEETYNITEDMVDLVDTYRFPETKGSLRGKLVNLIAVRIGRAYEVQSTPEIDGLSVDYSSLGDTIVYDGIERPISDFFVITGDQAGDNINYTVEKIMTGTEIPSVVSAGKYNVKITVAREGYKTFSVTKPVTITKRQLTISGSTAADKDYDGTTAATINLGTVSNFAAGESFEISAVGRFVNAEVGEDKVVNVTYSIPKVYQNDYLAPASETLTATINAVTLPEIPGLSFTPLSDISYDGTDQNVEDLIEDNTRPGDTITYSPETVKNPGTYEIKVKVSRSGYQDYSTTIQLVVGTRAITRIDTPLSKLYDGTTTGLDVVISPSTLRYIVPGDDVSVRIVTEDYPSAAVGSYELNATYILSGADASKYHMDGEVVDATIRSAGPQPTGSIEFSTETAYYTGSAQNVEDFVIVDGLEEGDAVTYSPSTITSVGDHEITATVTHEGYDDYVTDFTLTVLPKPLTITGTTVDSKEYDGNNTATVNLGTVNGLVDGEDVQIAASGSFDNVVPGEYDVEVEYTLTGSDASNYSLASETKSATITRKQLSVAGTLVEEKNYDETTDATVILGTVSGIVSGDDVEVIASSEFPSAEVGSYSVTISYRLSGTDEGNYTAPSSSVYRAKINAVEVAPVYTYSAVANGGPTKTTTEIAVNLLGADSSVFPASIPYSQIQIGGDAVLNTDAEECVGSLGIFAIPVRMKKGAKDSYEITIQINAGNQDINVKPVPAYFMSGYWGCYPCNLTGATAPTADQIENMYGINVLTGAKVSPISCTFALDERDWTVETQKNGVTGDDADIYENGCGYTFFITCWDDTEIGAITNELSIPQNAAFNPFVITINGVEYRGVVSKNCEFPAGTSPYTVNLN